LRSGIGRGLEPRERRTIFAGIAVLVFAVVATQLALPFARRWSEREALIDATRARLARLKMIAGREAEIRQNASMHDTQLETGGVRLLRARSPALASSTLQALIREHARVSGVSVTRMDVAGTVDDVATAAVPATISAIGDIYGVARFLQLLQHGSRLLDIRELVISANPTLRGELLQFSVTLRAPFVNGE
jgi:type II secretory pathway component PulM